MSEENKKAEESAEKNNSETLVNNDQSAEIQAASEERSEENTAVVLKEKRELSEPMTEADAKKNMSRRSRRTFLVGGATALAAVFGWRWMPDETKQNLLRGAFRTNEQVSRILFDKDDLAPEFSRELAGDRVNGMIGLGEDFDAANWNLQVVGVNDPQGFPQFNSQMTFTGEDNAPRSMDAPPAPNKAVSGLVLSLDDIKSLPRVEMTTELKCIEGWSVIINWAGARFSDFAAKFAPPADTKYVSLVTPDSSYYVGWDMPSIMHPQTLLAYEMNGAPLTSEHGAPLRLVTTTKYGIKQLKRIGRIEYTNERPADYWAEQGYDWYSGH
ncbi:MAG: molybdopterin-dependent oxidoreductase [Pyrinomonadaceae bacterium]